MYKRLLAAVAAACCVSTAAPAAVVMSSETVTGAYTGPAPTFDFETAMPITGGTLASDSQALVRARPVGSTGLFYSVGTADGSTATLDLTRFGPISEFSLLWGSIDDYNWLEFLDASGDVIDRVGGTDVYADAATDTTQSRVVNFRFSDEARASLSSVRFISYGNAFEFDNINVVPTAVPEPGSWALMLVGFGAVGYSIRGARHRLRQAI